MIVKLKTDAGWVYLDSVDEFRSYGIFRADDGQPECFESVSALRPAVDRVWGDSREFDREVWPCLGDELHGKPGARYVESGVARLHDGRNVLVLWADEAYLVSDKGDTIDRLR